MEDLKEVEKCLPEPILPWDRFSSWLHSICVVTFDLELGQAIESVFPGHIALSEADKTSICYLVILLSTFFTVPVPLRILSIGSWLMWLGCVSVLGLRTAINS